jgi:hypothetical protein
VPYFDVDDVRQWLPAENGIHDQTGKPKADVVLGWCGDISNEIDVSLAQGGATVPVTDPKLVAKLKMRGAREAAYQVMAVRAAATSSKIDLLYEGWHTEYEALLVAFATTEDAIVTGATEASRPDSFTRDADWTDPTDPRNPSFVKDYVP